MQHDPKDPNNRERQPEAGTNQDLNLTNRDASLINEETPVAGTQPAQETQTGGDDPRLNQAGNNAETGPEYGDAEDPTFEAL